MISATFSNKMKVRSNPPSLLGLEADDADDLAMGKFSEVFIQWGNPNLNGSSNGFFMGYSSTIHPTRFPSNGSNVGVHYFKTNP